MWTRQSLLFLMLWTIGSASVLPSLSSPHISVCPESCNCTTNEDNLHKATCTDLQSLHKFSLRNKHYNINIIDLHGVDIMEVDRELDKFTEVVSIDLSYNKISNLNKLLRNSKKLIHLNLSHNQLKKFSSISIPTSVSSLDLSHNSLHNVPSDLKSLHALEHLQLDGNPLHCTCDNFKLLEYLLSQNIVIDDVKCVSSESKTAKSWKSYDISEMCSDKKSSFKNANPPSPALEDTMMGDQPIDSSVDLIGEKTTNDKLMPLSNSDDLNNGKVWESSAGNVDDDDKAFLGVSTEKSVIDDFEGSGDVETIAGRSHSEMGKLQVEPSSATEEYEGSGDSTTEPEIILGVSDISDYYEEGSGDEESNVTTTTEAFIEGLFPPYFDDNFSASEEPLDIPVSINVFKGKIDWDATEQSVTEKVAVTEEVIVPVRSKEVEASVEEDDNITESGISGNLKEEPQAATKSSVGTYICIGILVAIVVGLIGLTIIKNCVRKSRASHNIRQTKKDVEKDGEEMIDMNKSLLGKPLQAPNENEKKLNGKYELVPTHEPSKKGENGILDSKKSLSDEALRKSPENEKENPNNNIEKEAIQKEAPNNMSPHQNAPSSPKISLPTPEARAPSRTSVDSPHMNGGHVPESNLLAPPTDYIPVYNQDSGRVRIKLTETPKPKTPILINRSRSNAGDIIITPATSLDNSPSKSST